MRRRTLWLIAVPHGSEVVFKTAAAFGLHLAAKRGEPFDADTKPVVLSRKVTTQVGGW